MHLNSSNRKLVLSNWLATHQIEEFSRHLKLQKFIFFYESFTKLENESADFSYLRAYLNGPVFSDVFGDYNNRRDLFLDTMSHQDAWPTINENRAKLAGFIVKILNERELSDLTHEFDVWKVKETLIRQGVKNVPMRESDFSDNDLFLLKTLSEMYPMELINEISIISIGDKNFLISKEDMNKLSAEQENIFVNLAEADLNNPVYVSLSEDGVLLID